MLEIKKEARASRRQAGNHAFISWNIESMTEWNKMLDGGLFITRTNRFNNSFPLSSLSSAWSAIVYLHDHSPSLFVSFFMTLSHPVCPGWVTSPVSRSADTLTVDLTGRLTSGLNDWLMSHWPTNCSPAPEHRKMSVCLRDPQLLRFRLGEWTFCQGLNEQFRAQTAQMCTYATLRGCKLQRRTPSVVTPAWKLAGFQYESVSLGGGWLDKLPGQRRGNASIVVCLFSFSSLFLCLPRGRWAEAHWSALRGPDLHSQSSGNWVLVTVSFKT